MSVVENLEMGCYGRKFDTKAARVERLNWVFETFLGWPSGAHRSAAHYRAVNSRCWPSGVP